MQAFSLVLRAPALPGRECQRRLVERAQCLVKASNHGITSRHLNCTRDARRGQLSLRSLRLFASASGAPPAASAPDPQKTFNSMQEKHFNTVPEPAPLTAEVQSKLKAIASSFPMPAGARVLDICTGDGNMIPFIQEAGASFILGVDLSQKRLERAQARFPDPGPLGNAPGVRFWHGDVADLPVYQGPFQAAFLNGAFESLRDPHETLARVLLRVAPGGHLVISHPQGRAAVEAKRQAQPDVYPQPLPTESELKALIRDLPVRLSTFEDSAEKYLAVLQVPLLYALDPKGPPARLGGAVVAGFGRGSSKLGFPTANLPPEPLAKELERLPRGVYFGWAALKGEPGVHKMVMNIGQRPTFADGAGDTVEVHVMHDFKRQFYGEELRVVVLGFIRPELRFTSLAALVDRIRTDVGLAQNALSAPEMAKFSEDEYLNFKA